MVIVIIESRAGLKNLPDMLKNDCIDVFFIGGGDLAQDMGYDLHMLEEGDERPKDVQEAIDGAIDAILGANRTAGLLVNRGKRRCLRRPGRAFLLRDGEQSAGDPGPGISWTAPAGRDRRNGRVRDMPRMTTSDDVEIYYEEVGSGVPIVFSHEFGDNYETWEPQLDYFGRRYRCVTYAARRISSLRHSGRHGKIHAGPGFCRYRRADGSSRCRSSPSRRRIHGILRRTQFRARQSRSGALAGGGIRAAHGSDLENRVAVLEGIEARARSIRRGRGREDGNEPLPKIQCACPSRLRIPVGWETFRARLAKAFRRGMRPHSSRGVRRQAVGLFAEGSVRGIRRTGAADVRRYRPRQPIQPTLFMHRHMPRAGLLVFPWSGHNLNIEEPEAFNRALKDFFHAVEHDRWGYDRSSDATGRVA